MSSGNVTLSTFFHIYLHVCILLANSGSRAV